ncbi:Zinc finger protein 500 [Merluccius polli]|uniref:Zinc finger protein 500 n=1 Tax=Merluccius polli TaxID=89951 RepID=A0AA47N8P8_MERPO|nr:Zinc finger protein 500 [Merluccius polli]
MPVSLPLPLLSQICRKAHLWNRLLQKYRFVCVSLYVENQETPDVILIKDEEDLGGCRPAVEDCDGFGDRSMQRAAPTTESLHVDAPGSSHMSGRSEELRILSVHGQGEEGRLAADGPDTLFTASELEALSSLSPDPGITHNSLFSFNSGGPSERVPAARGMQDGAGGRPGRDGQAERLHRLQAALSLNHAGAAGDDRGRPPGQFPPPQHSLVVFPHAAAKSMDCSFCGERFTCREELILHRAGHTGERPSSCALCGKSFANKATLNIHMRIHTGEKPYVCVQCGKSFSQSCSLKIHLRTHSGEKPYVCPQCTASFNNPSNLRRHMVKHSSTRRFDTG